MCGSRGAPVQTSRKPPGAPNPHWQARIHTAASPPSSSSCHQVGSLHENHDPITRYLFASHLLEIFYASIAFGSNCFFQTPLADAFGAHALLIRQMHMAAMRHKRTGKVDHQNVAHQFQLKYSFIQLRGSLHSELPAEHNTDMLSHLLSA